MNFQRCCCMLAGLALLTLTSCGKSPVRELQEKVSQAPRAMVLGTWIGRFEFDDPEIIDKLGRSINSADREVMQQLRDVARQTRYYQFQDNGQVDFYDAQRRRPFRGRWDVAFVEGRTVGVNIRTSAQFNVVRPITFLAENVFIIRPRLNGAPYERFGRVVFRRAQTQPGIGQPVVEEGLPLNG